MSARMDRWRERTREERGVLPQGVLLDVTRSTIDGSPIFVVATRIAAKTTNDKQDGIIQVYALLEDEHPGEAVRNGSDYALCGDCPFRRKLCYTEPAREATHIWRAYHEGRYHVLPTSEFESFFAGCEVRITAYPDPTCVPLSVWKPILAAANLVLAYTHRWHVDEVTVEDWGWCMASTQSISGTLRAQAAGWRTFRVRGPGERLLLGERQCPDALGELNCSECRACHGLRGTGGDHMSIEAHRALGRAWPVADAAIERALIAGEGDAVSEAIQAARMEWLFPAGALDPTVEDRVNDYYSKDSPDPG